MDGNRSSELVPGQLRAYARVCKARQSIFNGDIEHVIEHTTITTIVRCHTLRRFSPSLFCSVCSCLVAWQTRTSPWYPQTCQDTYKALNIQYHGEHQQHLEASVLVRWPQSWAAFRPRRSLSRTATPMPFQISQKASLTRQLTLAAMVSPSPWTRRVGSVERCQRFYSNSLILHQDAPAQHLPSAPWHRCRCSL